MIGTRVRDHETVAVPGDALLHPIAVGSLAVLVMNDHVLKAAYASWWTGKLSDAAGVVVLALTVQAIAELLGARVGRLTLAVSLLVSAAALIGIKAVPSVGHLYQVALGMAQWVPPAVLAAIDGSAPPPVRPVELARDVTDLLVLPVLVLVWLVMRRRGTEPSPYGSPWRPEASR